MSLSCWPWGRAWILGEEPTDRWTRTHKHHLCTPSCIPGGQVPAGKAGGGSPQGKGEGHTVVPGSGGLSWWPWWPWLALPPGGAHPPRVPASSTLEGGKELRQGARPSPRPLQQSLSALPLYRPHSLDLWFLMKNSLSLSLKVFSLT